MTISISVVVALLIAVWFARRHGHWTHEWLMLALGCFLGATAAGAFIITATTGLFSALGTAAVAAFHAIGAAL